MSATVRRKRTAGKTVQGRCGLCLNEAQLRDSHLLPASIYRLSREAASKNPNPVAVTRTGAVATSRQVSAHFLCDACEDRLSRGGETYVVAQCARPDGSFALRSLLMSMRPLMCDSVWSLFDISGTPAKIDQFLYFAASIFWRSSAKAWSSGGPPKKCIVLGQKYLEEFRRYLMGESSFPSRSRLFVHVWNEDTIHFTSSVPATFRVQRTHRHKFCIPGITFILFVGGNTTDNFDEGALNSSSGAFMWLCPWQEDSLFESFGRMVTRAIQARRRSP